MPMNSTVKQFSPNLNQTLKVDRYRAEIDGLRAFAVVAVIINHFNKEILPGGYLGVDIFFVISGYVITSSLSDRHSRDFRDFISGFYERRISRLVPALSVFVVIIGITICFFNPSPGSSLMTGLTSLFGLSNLYLLKQATDYFAQSTELNPFTHTWSLGVEEQFYILFPLLIWFSGFGRQSKNGVRNLFLIIVPLTIASLAGFVYLYSYNPSGAYFLMPSRFWEMAAGCLIFIGLQKRFSIVQSLCKVSPLLLLALILVVMFLPISYAVASTIAVVSLSSILIVSLKKGTIAFSFLTQPGVVYIGLISYSLYLWHWGLLSLSRWTIGLHWWSVPIQLSLILGLAAASYRYIEIPLRKGSWFGKRWKTFGLGAGILITTSSILCIGSALSSQIYVGKNNQVIGPDPLDVAEKGLPRETECRSQLNASVDDSKAICYKDYSQVAFNPLIALVGDSMAYSLFRIIEIEDSKHRFSTYVSFRNSCLVPQPLSSSSTKCREWSNKTLAEVLSLSKRHSSTILIINGYYQSYFDRSRDFFRPFLGTTNDYLGYLNQLESLAKMTRSYGHNISLILTMPVPVQSFDPYPQCHKEWFRQSLPMYCDRGTSVKSANLNPRDIRTEFKRIASIHPNVYTFDPSSLICVEDVCMVRNSRGDMLYIDDHHLSRKGADFIYPGYEVVRDAVFAK